MKENTKKILKREILRSFITVIAAVISALGLHVFVYPSNFAPSGVDGISTILQEVTGFNAGIFNFAINLPLLIAAWFILNKRYVIYTVGYTFLTSALLIILAEVGMYQYVTETDLILPAIFAGIAQGMTSIMLRIGGSAGGVDVAACMIQKKMPHKNVERIIAFLSYAVVGVSYFVYWDMNSILLSVIEIFVCERVTSSVLRTSRSAVEFKIVTDRPKEICDAILYRLHKTATVVDGQGIFSEENKTVILCVVNYHLIPHVLDIVDAFPGSFAYYSDVMGVRGHFDWSHSDESDEDKQKRALRKSRGSQS